MAETSATVVRRYVTDAIALEKDLQARFDGFTGEGVDNAAQKLFRKLAAVTKTHQDTLGTRLEQLGGSLAATRSFVEQIFGFRHKHFPNGHAGEATMAEQRRSGVRGN